MGKGYINKHSAKEIQMKLDAQRNMGGGAGGKAARLDGKCAYTCQVCKTTVPDLKTLRIHFENKHPKLPFDESKYTQKP